MGLGSVGDSVRLCRRGLHEIPEGKSCCPVCKKVNDDRHRRNARVSGKAAKAQREWYRRKYRTDEQFRLSENARNAAYYREIRVVGKRLGVCPLVAREIMELTADV